MINIFYKMAKIMYTYIQFLPYLMDASALHCEDVLFPMLDLSELRQHQKTASTDLTYFVDHHKPNIKILFSRCITSMTSLYHRQTLHTACNNKLGCSRNRVMIPVIKYFAKSLMITQGHST